MFPAVFYENMTYFCSSVLEVTSPRRAQQEAAHVCPRRSLLWPQPQLGVSFPGPRPELSAPHHPHLPHRHRSAQPSLGQIVKGRPELSTMFLSVSETTYTIYPSNIHVPPGTSGRGLFVIKAITDLTGHSGARRRRIPHSCGFYKKRERQTQTGRSAWGQRQTRTDVERQAWAATARSRKGEEGPSPEPRRSAIC